MLTIDALARALEAALPADYRACALRLATLLANRSGGQSAGTDESEAPADSDLSDALNALAGRAIRAGAGLISFGSGSQFGDIIFSGDVAGGNIVRITLNLPPPALPPAFHIPHLPNPLFCGRDGEIAALAQMLVAEPEADDRARAVPALVGTGGIGKSQLAAEWAYRFRNAFPGGVFWIAMEDPKLIVAQVANCGSPAGLDLAGWAAMDIEQRAAAVRRAWQEPVRRLLIFDNLEEPKLLQTWRPRGGGARVLVTSRRMVWSAASGVVPLPLRSLHRASSVRLLLAPRAQANQDDVDQWLADPGIASAADAIAAEVGDLPLALALAGAYLEANPSISLAEYCKQLREHAHTHPSLNTALEEGLPTSHAESITTTIALSYEQLNPVDGRDTLARTLLLRAAQLAPEPLPRSLLARLAERDTADASQAMEIDTALRRLAALGLIDLSATAISIHRLIGAYARAQCDHVAALCDAVIQALQGDIDLLDWKRAPSVAEPYLPHMLAFCDRWGAQLSAAGPHLLETCGWLLFHSGSRPAARPYFEHARVLAQRLVGDEHPIVASSLNSLGLLLHRLGHLSEARAYLQEALEMRERLLGRDHLSTAESLNNLGGLIFEQGEFAQARELLQRAHVIFEREWGPDDPRTAENMGYFGGLHWSQGDYAEARRYLEPALAIKRRTLGEEHPETAVYQSNLGHLLRLMGQLDEAQPMIEQALAIQESVLGPDHPDTAQTLSRLGNVVLEQGDLPRAQALYEQALAAHEKTLGPVHPQTGWGHWHIGWTLFPQGALAGAQAHFEQALMIWRQLYGPEHSNVATALESIGRVLQAQEQLHEARHAIEQALAIRERIFGVDNLYTQGTRQLLNSLTMQSDSGVS